MGKKNPEEMAKQRVTFMAGAAEKKFQKDKAGQLFDLMEQFRRVRLQQVALCRLCTARVPHCVAEDALPRSSSWRRC